MPPGGEGGLGHLQLWGPCGGVLEWPGLNAEALPAIEATLAAAKAQLATSQRAEQARSLSCRGQSATAYKRLGTACGGWLAQVAGGASDARASGAGRLRPPGAGRGALAAVCRTWGLSGHGLKGPHGEVARATSHLRLLRAWDQSSHT